MGKGEVKPIYLNIETAVRRQRNATLKFYGGRHDGAAARKTINIMDEIVIPPGLWKYVNWTLARMAAHWEAHPELHCDPLSYTLENFGTQRCPFFEDIQLMCPRVPDGPAGFTPSKGPVLLVVPAGLISN